MAITIKTEFESAVTRANQDIFVRSYIEKGKTIIEFDVRKRNYKPNLDIKGKIKWEAKTHPIEINELSTLFCPIIYRFIMARGSYYNKNGDRIFFTPEIEEVSTSQHVSKALVRLSCYLAVCCGVSLRKVSAIFTAVFLVEISKSSIKRWIDEIGENLPSDEEMLKRLMEIKKPTECHIDGYYPMGTDNCVMVVKDENDRILITNEVKSENKEDAVKFLSKLKDLGLSVVTAFSDYSKSYTESIREVFPDVKFQADHFHTVKNIWKHLKNAFLDYRRDVKAKSNACKPKEKKEELDRLATDLWDLRWAFLKKPENLNEEEKKRIADLQKQDEEGFLKSFRSIINNLVSLFDKSETEESGKAKLQRLREKTSTMENGHYNKIIKFLGDHWDEAMNYLKCNGACKRASNSEAGMRLLRRLEKNHDGIRSEVTRKYYIKIYQQINYFSNSDIADFLNGRGPSTG